LPPQSGGGAPPGNATATPAPSPTPAATFDPASVRISEVSVPVTPQYLAAAADGSVYFGYGANGGGSNLYRYDGGAFSQTVQAAPPAGYTSGAGVYGISSTAKQLYWLSAYGGPGFAPYVAVECSAGAPTLCEPTVDEPTTMLVDSTGTFWVGGWTFDGGGEIATSTNLRSDFADGIVQLVLGPGGAVWGALQNGSTYRIVQFALSNSAVSIAQSFALPSGAAAGSMTLGGDGALWFTDQQNNAIGRLTGNGSLSEYALPTADALGLPWFGLWQIATACDGTVWFSEPNAGKIGRIDGIGHINEFSVPTASGYPDAIAANASGKCVAPQVWVAEQRADKIAAVTF
jgi:virginiamycin B lyase